MIRFYFHPRPNPAKIALLWAIRARCAWVESEWDSRIGQILIQPVGWAEASRNAKAVFARLA